MSDGILIAHDLTDRCSAVSEAAGALAAQLSLPLSALHVISNQDVEAQREARAPDSAFIDVVINDLQTQLRSAVEQESGEFQGERGTYTILNDDPHTGIVGYLEQHNFDYVFLGVRNRSRVGKLVFGSVAQSVLLRTPTKVVVVPIGD